jgi:hypothetical protein
MSQTSEALLRAILSSVARQTFPEARLRDLVLPRGAGPNQMTAFNLCDGSKTQGEVAKAAALDPGNFSRTVARWIELGIMFKFGEGREAKLQHVYPLPPNSEPAKERDR